MQADAQSLPFAEEEFDIVLNVECSHRHPSVEAFHAEACRTLKQNGQLLLTDFRNHGENDAIHKAI
ncbi:MAG: class I SAM-dependent methyltransferase [Bacteroidales bacterium]